MKIFNGSHRYVDKGDLAAWDYQIGDFTVGSGWHTLDISAKVGAAERLVLLRMQIKSAAGGKEMRLRTNGNSNEFNMQSMFTHDNTLYYRDDVWVKTDANGVIEYWIISTTWNTINMSVRGYFTL